MSASSSGSYGVTRRGTEASTRMFTSPSISPEVTIGIPGATNNISVSLSGKPEVSIGISEITASMSAATSGTEVTIGTI